MFHDSITRAAQECVLEGAVSAKEVADSIGKPYSTLLRELNPFDARAKLGAETLVEIMRITGDIEPLKRMAEQLGFSLVPEAKQLAPSAPLREVPRQLAV